jgi:hypothetical protein
VLQRVDDQAGQRPRRTRNDVCALLRQAQAHDAPVLLDPQTLDQSGTRKLVEQVAGGRDVDGQGPSCNTAISGWSVMAASIHTCVPLIPHAASSTRECWCTAPMIRRNFCKVSRTSGEVMRRMGRGRL